MNTTPRYRALLRLMLSNILSSKLSSSEMRALSEELRRGRFPDELAYMIDQANRHFSSDEESDDSSDELSSLERLVKSRKITKSALLNILQSLGAEHLQSSTSIRNLLQAFIDTAPRARIQKLIDILESSTTSDSFLAGISGTRK